MITVPEVRLAVNADPKLDAKVTELRNAVEKFWELYVPGAFIYNAARVDVLTMLTDSDTKLWLKLRPVVSVTKVEERGLGDTDWTEFEDYHQVGAKLERFSGFWSHFVRVTYAGGYTDATCPSDIRQALLVQCKFSWERFDLSKVALSSQNFEGGAGVFLDANLCPLFKAAAAGYRGQSL